MWTGAKRVLRYLKKTAHYKLAFNDHDKPTGNDIQVYVDSSHADDADTRRSRCGYLIYFGKSLISWKTMLQKRRALSTAEAEYRATTIACKEILWIRRLLREVGIRQTKPSRMFEDNKACIKMIENPYVSGRNKHVELDAHFIRDHYLLGNIDVKHVKSKKQKAAATQTATTGTSY